MTNKLLAINFGGIGDEILFLPVLKSIREAEPSTHITLLSEPRSKAIKDITNLIDEIKLFDIKKRPLMPRDYLDLLQILRNGRYDTVISSGSSPLVACLLFASRIQNRIGYDSGYLSRILLSKAVKLDKGQYASDMYHDLVQGIGITNRAVAPQIDLPETDLVQMKEFFAQVSPITQKVKRIVIHPGTSRLAIEKGIIKTWPAANWAALINQLIARNDLQVILAGGPDDEKTISQIEAALDPALSASHLFVSAYGKTKSLADLAALILMSDLLICVDSAPMHVGVAVNKPVLALFGPTDPARLLPNSPYWRAIKSNEVAAGSQRNKRTESGIKIQPDAVLQAALDLLQPMKVQ